MRLGIDLDGVCSNWQRQASKMLNSKFELELSYEHPEWDYLKKNTTKWQWKWLWSKAVESGLFARLEQMDGTFEALEELTEKHEVFLITSRPRRARRDTFDWISYNIPFDFAGLNFSDNKWEVSCDIYLDDKPENVLSIKEHRPDSLVVLRSQRYNEYLDWSPKVNGWEEFLKLVKEYKK